jgi:hypothetical protein
MTSNINKNKARLIVLSIFVIGFAAGALSMNLYERLMNNAENPKRSGTPQEVILRKIDKRVSLNSEQEVRVKTILSETSEEYKKIRNDMDPKLKEFEPRFTEVRRKSRERIRAELTESQLAEYEKLLEEEDKKREEGKQNK